MNNTVPAATDSKRSFAMALMVVSSVIISFGGLVLRSMEAAGAWQINFHRSVALFAVVCVLLLAQHRRNVVTVVINIGLSGCVAGMLLGVAGMTFLQAMTRTTIANALFIMGAVPFFAALLARIFLKEKLTTATLVTMCIAVAGLTTMVVEGINIGFGAGNGFALATAILFASYAVMLRGNRRREMLPTLLISAVVLLVVSAIIESDLRVSVHDLLLCFLWGGGLAGIAHWMFIYSSRHLAAAEVTLFMMLESALAPLWVWLVISEQPSRWTIIGGAVIIMSVTVRALVELAGKSRAAQIKSPPPV